MVGAEEGTEVKLTHVLTAVNENPGYTALAPLWTRQWRRLDPGVTPVIVCIGETTAQQLDSLSGDAELMPWTPPSGMSTQFAAQCIRLFAPALIDTAGAVMIDDVDEIPLSPRWFSERLDSVPDGRFAQFRPRWCVDARGAIEQMNMADCAATPQTWGEVTRVARRKDVDKEMAQLWKDTEHVEGAMAVGWTADQIHLTGLVRRWAERTRGFHAEMPEMTGFQGLWLAPRYSATNVGFERRVESVAARRLASVRTEIAQGVWTTFEAARPAAALAKVNQGCADTAPSADGSKSRTAALTRKELR